MIIFLYALLLLSNCKVELHYLVDEQVLNVYRPAEQNGVQLFGAVYLKAEHGSVLPIKTDSRDRDGVRWRVAEFTNVTQGSMTMFSDDEEIDIVLEVTQIKLEGEPDCQPILVNNLMFSESLFALAFTTSHECKYNTIKSEQPTHNNTYNQLQGVPQANRHQYLHKGQYVMHGDGYFKYRLEWQLKVEEGGVDSHGATIVYKRASSNYTTLKYPSHAMVSSIVPQRSQPPHFSPQLLDDTSFGVAFIYDSAQLTAEQYLTLLEEWGSSRFFYAVISSVSKDWSVNQMKQHLLGGWFGRAEMFEFGDYTIVVLQPGCDIQEMTNQIVKKRIALPEGYLTVLHRPICSPSDDICSGVPQMQSYQRLIFELKKQLTTQSLALMESDTRRIEGVDKILWNVSFVRYRDAISLPDFLEDMKRSVTTTEYFLEQAAAAFNTAGRVIGTLVRSIVLDNLELASGLWGLCIAILLFTVLWAMNALHRTLLVTEK